MTDSEKLKALQERVDTLEERELALMSIAIYSFLTVRQFPSDLTDEKREQYDIYMGKLVKAVDTYFQIGKE